MDEHERLEFQAIVAEVELDDELTRTRRRMLLVGHVLLGLALGGVMVGVGGILALAALAGDREAGASGGSVWPLLAPALGLMAAGPVVALRVAGLKWWQALVAAPTLGALSYALWTLR